MTVVDIDPPDADPAGGAFLQEGRPFDTYTIKETVPVTGLDNPDVVVTYEWVCESPGRITHTGIYCDDLVSNRVGDLEAVY